MPSIRSWESEMQLPRIFAGTRIAIIILEPEDIIGPDHPEHPSDITKHPVTVSPDGELVELDFKSMEPMLDWIEKAIDADAVRKAFASKALPSINVEVYTNEQRDIFGVSMQVASVGEATRSVIEMLLNAPDDDEDEDAVEPPEAEVEVPAEFFEEVTDGANA